MTGDDVFMYDPIELDRPGFRLLQLMQGDGPTIECMLYQAYLDGTDTVPYDALSYTWGSIEKNATVTVNGKSLKITSNLLSALRQLRSKNVDRVLWIDAICIDQENERERGHQVQQMCEIYSQAEEVIVWLGHATPRTELLMESLQRLEQQSSVHEYRTWDLRQWETFWQLIPQHPKAWLAEGLGTLLKRDWFKRIWILQEITRSRKASIWCGSKSIKAHIFSIAPSLIVIKPERHCQAVLDIMPGRLRDKSWWSESRDLYNLLSKFRESEASDPRDKVYALLGISSDAQDTVDLRPDYTKSIQQVIQDTSSFLFGPSDLSYETMSGLLSDLSSRHAAAFLDIVRTSDLRSVENFLMRRGLDIRLHVDTLKAIMENKDNGRDILKLILRTHGNEVKITSGLFKTVVEDMECGADVVSLLLHACKRPSDYEEVIKALQSAAATGNGSVVELLVANSAMLDSLDINGNFQDECYKYVLYSASANGQRDILKLLFDRSAATQGNISPQIRRTRVGIYDPARHDLALALASANGHDHVIDLLVEMEADVNMQKVFSSRIHRDLGASKYTAVTMLVDKGAEVNSHGMIYVNPLYLASINGHEEVVRLLLEKGADVNAHSSMYSERCHGTALKAAMARGHKDVVKILLENGAK